MASARLANSTVNHSQTDTQKMNPAGASPLPARAWNQSSVVRIDPTYTTNMTGFRSWWRGVSLRNESTMAGPRIAVSKRERALPEVTVALLSSASARQHEVFDDRPEGQRRHIGQRPHQDDDADEQGHEERGVGGQGTRARGYDLLSRQRPRDGQNRHGQPVAPHQHAEAEGRVVEGGVGAEPGEGAAVVVG